LSASCPGMPHDQALSSVPFPAKAPCRRTAVCRRLRGCGGRGRRVRAGIIAFLHRVAAGGAASHDEASTSRSDPFIFTDAGTPSHRRSSSWHRWGGGCRRTPMRRVQQPLGHRHEQGALTDRLLPRFRQTPLSAVHVFPIYVCMNSRSFADAKMNAPESPKSSKLGNGYQPSLYRGSSRGDWLPNGARCRRALKLPGAKSEFASTRLR
jgi:hypothetical protein